MKLSNRRAIGLALFGLAFGGLTMVTASECMGDHGPSGVNDWLARPATASALQVPGGGAPAARLHGKGWQVYTCASRTAIGGSAPAYAWSLKAPDAQLFDAAGIPAGVHNAGPTWLSGDGSAVVAIRRAQADAPVAGAVPWLLLEGRAWTGDGVFSHVAFIQRLNTSGGVAPGGGCDASTVNTETRVPYEADYFFYGGPRGPDGPSP